MSCLHSLDERGSVLAVALVLITLTALIGGTFLLLADTEGGIAQTSAAERRHSTWPSPVSTPPSRSSEPPDSVGGRTTATAPSWPTG